MKNTVIQYGEQFVQGFSIKTQKVYCTVFPSEAKRFTAVAANDFIAKYSNKNHNFDTKRIRIHIIKPGQPFRPFEEGV
jgi:hypothetical protein